MGHVPCSWTARDDHYDAGRGWCQARLACPPLMHFRRADDMRRPQTPNGPNPSLRPKSRKAWFEISMTLKQACSSEYQGAQGAFKDSMIHGKSAIHITYRDSLRSSSMREPRDPLLKVVFYIYIKCYRHSVDMRVGDETRGSRRALANGVHVRCVKE
jgi:hypothetical protein